MHCPTIISDPSTPCGFLQSLFPKLGNDESLERAHAPQLYQISQALSPLDRCHCHSLVFFFTPPSTFHTYITPSPAFPSPAFSTLLPPTLVYSLLRRKVINRCPCSSHLFLTLITTTPGQYFLFPVPQFIWDKRAPAHRNATCIISSPSRRRQRNPKRASFNAGQSF